jgi:hypothetical protein
MACKSGINVISFIAMMTNLLVFDPVCTRPGISVGIGIEGMISPPMCTAMECRSGTGMTWNIERTICPQQSTRPLNAWNGVSMDYCIGIVITPLGSSLD